MTTLQKALLKELGEPKHYLLFRTYPEDAIKDAFELGWHARGRYDARKKIKAKGGK